MTFEPLPWPGFPRTMVYRHLDESLPPPAGYSSFDLYYKLATKGEGMTIFSDPGTVPRGKRVSMVWTREDEDVCVIGAHFTKIDGSEIVDWDTGAYERVETNLTAMWVALKAYYDPSISLDRFLWHDWGVDVRKPNPGVRETATGGVPGTGGADAQLPPQVAVSITFKTSHRRTWGRCYMPAPIQSEASAGRFVQSANFRTAWGNLLDDQASHSSPLVIWSPRHGGKALQYGKTQHEAGLDNPDSSSYAMTVDQVQVDDLFDVIRSRRFDKALVKSTHSLG